MNGPDDARVQPKTQKHYHLFWCDTPRKASTCLPAALLCQLRTVGLRLCGGCRLHHCSSGASNFRVERMRLDSDPLMKRAQENNNLETQTTPESRPNSEVQHPELSQQAGSEISEAEQFVTRGNPISSPAPFNPPPLGPSTFCSTDTYQLIGAKGEHGRRPPLRFSGPAPFFKDSEALNPTLQTL